MNLLAFKDALAALYNADSAVQAITGREDLNLMPRGAQAHDESLPVTTYLVIDAPEAPGTAGHASVSLRIECWIDVNKPNAIQNLETLMARAEALFTGPNLATHDIDASVNPIGRRRDGPEADGVRSIARDFTFDLTV